MNDLYPEDVPGFQEALDAVRAVGGILLPEVAARQLVMMAAAVLRPHMQAELLADLSDDDVIQAMNDFAPELGLADYFDRISNQLRKALDVQHG